MASKLQATLNQTDRRMFEELSLTSSSLSRRQSVQAQAPYLGYAPDLPHNLRPPTAALEVQGLIARPDPQSHGEVLTNDAGWTPIDEDRLGSNLPSLDGSSGRNVVLIRSFPLVTDTGVSSANEAPQGIIWVDGDGSTAGSAQMFRFSPSTSQWENVTFSTTGFSGPAVEPSGTISGDSSTFASMPDATVFHAGAPARSDGAGAIDQPVFILTNNIDPVQVYPETTNTLNYQPLTAQFEGTGNDGHFLAVSVETFNDRVYFLNTAERSGGTSIRHRNRLRRTARGTADPDPSILGSGFIDLDRFSGHGVAARTLGNVLACYFQDGVAFVRDTGDSAAPNAVQYLDTRRGLLSTHAVVSISNSQHFGIFDDGWWLLDSSGRWREVGVLNSQSSRHLKWKRAFYEQLDEERLHRLQCFYDKRRQGVRIILPQTDGTEVPWFYDTISDRVWPDEYDSGITVWGEISIPVQTAETWATVSETWDEIATTWAAEEVNEPVQRVVHGDSLTFVYIHDEAVVTRNGAQPRWLYKGGLAEVDGQIFTVKTLDRIIQEYITVGNSRPVQITALNEQGDQVSYTTNFQQSENIGIVELRRATFQMTGTHLGWITEGSGAVRIRGWQFDFILPQAPPLEVG